ncbi:hypothetical protein [Scytonema sp. NUACC26]|uniref:hypothetical protein n=1 Tax=Scytonema sp. NUACC26 TaxID=3140176 RepID=UPI0034DBBD50
MHQISVILPTDNDNISDILEGGEVSGRLVLPSKNTRVLALALREKLDKYARSHAQEFFSIEVNGLQLRQFLLSHKFDN